MNAICHAPGCEFCLPVVSGLPYNRRHMDEEDDEMTPVIEGDEEVVPWDVLRFSGLEAEFPNTDLTKLKESKIMKAAYACADDFDEEALDDQMPGQSFTCVRLYAKDTEAFRKKLADKLRPHCQKLAGAS